MESYSVDSLCLASFLSIIMLRCIHTAAGINSPFLIIAEWCSPVWLFHSWSVHSLVSGHWGY